MSSSSPAAATVSTTLVQPRPRKWIVGIMIGSMLFAQLVNAGCNVAYKTVHNMYFSLRILVAYRYWIAFVVIGLFTYFRDRNMRAQQPLTRTIWFYVTCCAVMLAVGENVGAESFKISNASIVSAIANLAPAAVTYVVALIFREETLQRTWACGLKVSGTVVSIGGAMIFAFYKGEELYVWTSSYNWLNLNQAKDPATRHLDTAPVKGAALPFVSCIIFSLQLLVFSRLIRRFPGLSSTSLVFFATAIFSTIYALVVEWRDSKLWKLDSKIRWLGCLYSGTFATGITTMIVAWCARAMGPLFVSAFSPFSLIITTIAGLLFLGRG